MENKNYIVKREDIYVGEVIKTSNVVRYNGTDTFRLKNQDLIANPFQKLRSTLFVPTEEELSNDLLFKCPNYPILNYTDDYICLGIKRDSIVIHNFLPLRDLLEYYKYPEELTINDIIRIRNTFFTGRFAKDNAKLFGMEELIPDDFIFTKKGIEITDYNRRVKEYQKTLNLNSKREFISVKEGILPEEYMNLIDTFGNRLYDSGIIDSFNSVPGEGKVKKLVKN